MILQVNQKSIGKNKRIKTVPVEYKTVPGNVYDLISETVKIMVSDFISRAENRVTPLSDEQINDLAEIGRVSFGIIYNENIPNYEESIATAILAYRDGLVAIFINDEIVDVEAESPTPTEEELRNCKIELHENDTISFVRLTMLSGSMW